MEKKIAEFIKRSRYRNPELYTDVAVEGYDYVVCPISGARMYMIKSNYITNVLGMTEMEYPNIKRICDKRKENIKKGLREIDPVSGLSKYEVGQVKARSILNQVDHTGLSGYDKKGQKTRATHMARVDDLGRTGYRRQADGRMTTILPNGLTVEQNAHKKQKETILKNGSSGSGGASKISKKVLSPVILLLETNNIKFYFDKQEYGIRDPESGNHYFYDLTIPELKITIEYQSSAWHSNPARDDDKWQQWVPPRGKPKTANESIEYDYNKARSLYKTRGIITYYVWEDTAADDVEEILCLLKM